MHFLILLDPRNFNWKLIWTLITLIALFAGWAIWSGEGDKQDLINSLEKMEVPRDQETKLPIMDLDNDNYLRDKKFHAAIVGKEFLIKGVEVTIVVPQLNTHKDRINNEEYVTFLQSDVVSSGCIEKLQLAVNETPPASLREPELSTLIKSVCGKSVSPAGDQLSAKEIVDAEAAQKICQSKKPCAPCLIVKGEDAPIGQCQAQKISFRDLSGVLTNSGQMWLNVSFKPSKTLSYKRQTS